MELCGEFRRTDRVDTGAQAVAGAQARAGAISSAAARVKFSGTNANEFLKKYVFWGCKTNANEFLKNYVSRVEVVICEREPHRVGL